MWFSRKRRRVSGVTVLVGICGDIDGRRHRLRRLARTRRKGVALIVVPLLVVAGVAAGMEIARRADPAHEVRLLGNDRLAPMIARERAGSAQVFGFASRSAGRATAIRIYLGAHSHTTKLVAGIYAYGGGFPRWRLVLGRLSEPRAGRWNTVKIRPTEILSGNRYGIAVLGSAGILYLRDHPGKDCQDTNSEQISATALPASWQSERLVIACRISAYVVGTSQVTGTGARASADSLRGRRGQSSPQAVVGSVGAPAVTCTTKLNPGANLQSALAAASPGSVVCLNGGNWTGQQITGLTPLAPGVTLAATPGATVDVAGITTIGQVDNLTVEGINFSHRFGLQAGANNVTLKYNTFENLPGEYAVYSYPQASGHPDSVVDGVRVLYNQINHAENCLEVDGGAGEQSHWTFAHNVCGPAIGLGGGNDSHYVQFGGVNGLVFDHNAFIGPYDAAGLAAGPHNNVLHIWGGEANVQIENNLMWHTDSIGQTILIEQGNIDNITISNNVDVEDPKCFSTRTGCPAEAWEVGNGHRVWIENNTVVSSYWGEIDGGGDSNYAKVTNQTVANNIVAPAAPGGGANYGGSCASSCTYADNVSGDSSAPGSGAIHNWRPSWQNTIWTPTNGSPWHPPPRGYYVPAGIPTALGYQGTIGP